MDTWQNNIFFELKSRILRGIHAFYAVAIRPRSRDEDNRRRELIYTTLILATIVLLLVLYAIIILDTVSLGAQYDGISWVYFPFYIVPFIGLYGAARYGYYRPAAYAFVILYFAFIVSGAWRWGIDLPSVPLNFAFLIVLASIVIGPRFAIILAITVAATIGSIGYQQKMAPRQSQLQWRTGPMQASEPIQYIVILAGVVCVSWLSNREIEKSLHRARTSEYELTQERNMLEKKVEERAKALEIARIEKMGELYRFAEFGRLSSGLFHDFINAFSSILCEQELSHTKNSTATADAKQHIEEARSGGKRMDTFVRALRKQLTQDNYAKEEFSIGNAIEDAVYLLSYKAKVAGVLLIVSMPERVCIHGSEFAFSHSMSNLIANAIDSYEDAPATIKKQIEIAVRATSAFVTISIRDYGRGIPDDMQEKIFDPFFTTKTKDKGMGIGLALVKSNIEKHFRGSIVLTSHPNQGTTFTISIPQNNETDIHWESAPPESYRFFEKNPKRVRDV